MSAIVLAGGAAAGELAEAAGTNVKALVPVGGQTLLDICLDALRNSGLVNEIVLVGNTDALQSFAATDVRLILGGATAPENVEIALRTMFDEIADGTPDDSARVLLAASDLPFLNGAAVRRFVADAWTNAKDADIVFPITSRTIYERDFPTLPRVWTPIADYPCTGGSLLLVRPSAIFRNRALIEKVFAARKSQTQMAMLLGLPFVLRLKLGTLRVHDAERRVGEITGCRCVALRECDPRLVVDVDDANGYRQILSLF